jgi:hypothetical protein
MRRLLYITMISLLMGCASTGPQKWATEKIIVTRDIDGKVLVVEEHYVPVVPFNFWSTLIDIGKKAGGL